MGFLNDGKWKVKAKKLQFPVQKDEGNFHRDLFSEKFFDEKYIFGNFLRAFLKLRMKSL